MMSACPVRTAVPFFSLSLLMLWSLTPGAASSSNDDFTQVLSRANAPAPPPYRAFRRLEAGNPTSDKYGWMEVWTEYQPGQGFSYEVTRESGSEYVRDKVLRGILNTERELLAGGKPLRAPLVAANYTFENGGTADSGLQRILLRPNRKEHGIVDGSAFVDAQRGGLVRIEGRLVKSPSFWVRDVDVTWKFANVGDAIVPLELSSSARVRFYGRSSFRMTYQYESVDGRPAARILAAMPDAQ
ncbi:MAG TPA: hypothetical protein VFP85_14070 [Vicinamibacterales bacterium]|nr:hypothetical protein [Vicinamibacterales bacterium]